MEKVIRYRVAIIPQLARRVVEDSHGYLGSGGVWSHQRVVLQPKIQEGPYKGHYDAAWIRWGRTPLPEGLYAFTLDQLIELLNEGHANLGSMSVPLIALRIKPILVEDWGY